VTPSHRDLRRGRPGGPPGGSPYSVLNMEVFTVMHAIEIGSGCRLHGNIRAEWIRVGEKNTLFGSLRSTGAIRIGTGTTVHGTLVSEGALTVGRKVHILGSARGMTLALHDEARVDGTIRAPEGVTMIRSNEAARIWSSRTWSSWSPPSPPWPTTSPAGTGGDHATRLLVDERRICWRWRSVRERSGTPPPSCSGGRIRISWTVRGGGTGDLPGVPPNLGRGGPGIFQRSPRGEVSPAMEDLAPDREQKLEALLRDLWNGPVNGEAWTAAADPGWALR